MTTYNRGLTTAVVTMGVLLLLLMLLWPVQPVFAEQAPGDAGSGIVKNGKITLTLRDTAITEVMEMLSRAAHVNILMAENIKGNISLNLYDVSIDEAIDAIVASAGYGVERRRAATSLSSVPRRASIQPADRPACVPSRCSIPTRT